MATTNVLLREDVDNLGGRGEIVKVRAGFARNYLLPQGLATLATKGNVKRVEQERSALLRKAATEKMTAQAQADQMASISLEFERKTGEQGALFGSVTSMDIAEALRAKGYEIDRRKINLKDAIKETGNFTVPVKLHREVILEVPVSVIPEGGIAEAETEPKAEAKTETVETVESVESVETADTVENADTADTADETPEA
ncbi:MAG: 50S ribosomal protein L9, partial [Pyrinomonadaceae bacterium]